ncbi:type II 3-dehydroquinate dehydratase [bacterium]|nr:type II 3-dehydroquinate dehydratase [bacterium]
MKFLVLEGPNLDGVGRREPEIYGDEKRSEALARLVKWAKEKGWELVLEQEGDEAALVACLAEAKEKGFVGVLFNPGAFSHASLALRDGAKGTALPLVEAHLSAIHGRREAWRRKLVVAGAGHPVISGMGYLGYQLGICALVCLVKDGAFRP